MKREAKGMLKSFLVELAVYSVLVAAYFLVVLSFLGDWLSDLHHRHRVSYAVVALLLVIGQGVVLEALTRVLLGWIKPRAEA